MKKLFLLFSLAVTSLSSQAQIYISGSSPYNESFDAIGSGITGAPGWAVYSGAGFNFLGSLATLNSATCLPSYLSSDSSCIAEVVVGGFKNFPSAAVCHAGDDWCLATPPSYSNRSLGVRQVSPTNASHPNLDSGAAFVFKIANTNGMSAVGMSFDLQSLDSSSPRQTTWRVDYALGSSTTFVPGTVSGTLTTGNHSFGSNTVNATFGTALDNQSLPVTFRIVTLVYSSSAGGTGNRASTGIDNFKLTWTGNARMAVANVAGQAQTSLSVLGNATSDKITFGYGVDVEGAYNFAIYDLSGRILHTQQINAIAGNEQFEVSGLNLPAGLYIAKMSNGNTSAVAKVAVQ